MTPTMFSLDHLLFDLAVGVAASFLLVIALRSFRVAYLILRGDKNEYERNRNRVGSLTNVIRGTVPTKYDGTRDDLIAAGVAVDLKKNEWVEQGRLSDEALQDALAH